jgi:hypothetical protein
MRDEKKEPIARFAIPENCPASVRHAHEQLVKLGVHLNENLIALRDATNAIEDAARQDVQAAATAIRAGDTSFVTPGNERLARLAADEIRLHVEALKQAVDDAGTDLVLAIESVQSAWLDEEQENAIAARSAYHSAIDDAQAAASKLAESRHVAEWLARFDGEKLREHSGVPSVRHRHRFLPASKLHLHVPSAGIPGASINVDEVEVSSLFDALKRLTNDPDLLSREARRLATATA